MPGEQKLVSTAMTVLEHRTSRRGLLARIAIGASAMAVAPIRFLVRPESAWAITCSSCSPSSTCCSQTTSCFCCTITGSNNCPTNTHRCGWWFCSGNGITYIDCCGNCGSAFCCSGSCGNRQGCRNGREYTNCGCAMSSCSCVTQNVIHCRITRRVSGAPDCCWGSRLPGNCDSPPACASV